ncbi:Cdc25 phosphatase Ibp1 [Coemansia sp. RSA 1200]|nr:Cdc25 phosphatase Ibp1 [Coemansia sp. RSA 1200]
MSVPERLTVDELAAFVRNKDKVAGTDYVVIDVRDEDFKVGHIPGAVNVPAHEIRGNASRLLSEYGGVPIIVFHCALSQVRGPRSARIYKEAVAEALEAAANVGGAGEGGGPLADQKVCVLTGGFVAWAYRFKDTEPELVAGFDQQLWNDENF